MSRRKVFLLLFPILALAASGLLLLGGEPGRSRLSVAAARAVWTVQVASLAVGQVVPWVLLVAALSITALASLRGDEAPTRRDRRKGRFEDRSRTAVWDSRIAGGCRSAFLRRPLERELRRLACEVFLHADGVEAGDAERYVAGTGSDVPDAVRSLFSAGDRDDRVAGFSSRIRPAWDRKAKAEQSAAYRRWIAEVVDSLEKRMGGTGDDAH